METNPGQKKINSIYDYGSDPYFQQQLAKELKKYRFAASGKDIKKGGAAPDADTFQKIYRQAAYNYQNGADNDWYDTEYDPYANNVEKNATYSKLASQLKRAPTTDEYDKYFTTSVKYKGQYTNTVEDEQAQAAGLKPVKYQYNDKVEAEVRALDAARQAGTLTPENYWTIAPTMKEITDWTVAREQKRLEDEAEGKTTKRYSFEGTKAENLPLDVEYMKSLGWDEKTGFSNIPQQQRAAVGKALGVVGAQAATALATPVQPQQTAQPQSSPRALQARPVGVQNALDNAVYGNAAAQQALKPRPLTQTGNFWQDAAQNFGTGMQMKAQQEQQDSRYLQSALGAGSGLVKEGIAAAEAGIQGKPYAFGMGIDPKEGITTREYAPILFDYLDMLSKTVPIKGVTGENPFTTIRKWVEYTPAARTVANVLGDIGTDPTAYITGEMLGGLYNSIKAGKTAQALKILDDAKDAAIAGSKVMGAADNVVAAADNVIPAAKPITAPVKKYGMPMQRVRDIKAAEAMPPARSIARQNDSGVKIAQELTPTTPKQPQYLAQTDEAMTTSGKLPKAKEIGTPGAAKYDLADDAMPQGAKERGVSENIRTDVNSPAELRKDLAKDPLVYQAAGNEETLAKAQNVFDSTYAKGDIEGAIARVSELVDQMKPEAAPLSVMIARELRTSGDVARARQVLSYAAEKATSAGQYGQAFKILRSADPETMTLTLERQLRKLNTEGAAAYGKKWKDFDILPNEIEAINKIPAGDQAAFEKVMADIQKRIAGQMPASALEKLKGWRDISMLLNPKTQIRNVLGNVAMAGMRKTAGKVSAALQGGTKLVARAIGKEFKPTEALWIKKEFRNLATEAFNSRKSDLLRGAGKYQEGIRLNMPDKRVFQASPIEATRKFTYKLLEWGDNPFYKSAYIDRLGAYMQARGIKSLDNIPSEALELAKKAAEQATFKDASWLSSMLNKGKNVPANAGLGRKTLSVALEAFAPYTKTPINIVQRGVQYSPAGIVNGLAKIAKEGGAAAIDEIAKGLTGTGVVALGYFLASRGVLTGAASDDQDMAAYDKATGNAPFSVFGKYTYDWIQPFSIPLTIGAEIYNAVKEDPAKQRKLEQMAENPNGKQWTDIVGELAGGFLNAFGAAGDTVYNMSVLQGAQSLFGGSGGFMEGVARLPFNYASQFIPTALGQLARTLDPVQRQTYYGAGTIGEFLQTQYAAVASRIPGLRQTLQPKVTPFGKPIQDIGNPAARAAQQFAGPGTATIPQDIDPQIDAEIRRLAATGEKSQFPRVAARSFKFKSANGDQRTAMLDGKNYEMFQSDLGRASIERVKKLISNADYQKMDDEDKAKAISDEYTFANNYAQFQYLKRNGMIPAGILRKTEAGWAKTLAAMLGCSKKEAIEMNK